MLISLKSDVQKRIRLTLIIDLANDSIGSSECRDSNSAIICIYKTWFLGPENKSKTSILFGLVFA